MPEYTCPPRLGWLLQASYASECRGLKVGDRDSRIPALRVVAPDRGSLPMGDEDQGLRETHPSVQNPGEEG